MAGKKVQPAAKDKGAPGEATKQRDTTSMPADKVDQPSNSGQPGQGETAGAGLQESQEFRQLVSSLALSGAASALFSPTGNQEQPGTPVAGSGVALEPAPPGDGQNCFADSSPTSIHGLAVTSSRDGFWRAGRQWTKAEQLVEVADLTERQVRLICDEPGLQVYYIDLPVPGKEGA